MQGNLARQLVAIRQSKPHVKPPPSSTDFFLLHLTRHSASPMSEIQANFTVPQLIAVLVIGFLVVRWIFFSSSATSQTSTSHAASRSRVNPAQVEQVAQMFPQFSAREIMWDLQRNGGSVQATTERVLSGRGLDTVSKFSMPASPANDHSFDAPIPNTARIATAIISTSDPTNFGACIRIGKTKCLTIQSSSKLS